MKRTGVLEVPGMMRWVLGGAIASELSEELSEAVEREGGQMATGEGERFMMRGAGGVVGAAARDEE